MSSYRTGNHQQPQNVYRDDTHIGVMFTAEDAALVVEALHHVEQAHGPALPVVVARYPAFPAEVIASALAADSCTCVYRPTGTPDPACPVRQGRRAKGPKPPPVGEGCICDGSGRTCPRHGAVI